MPTLSERLESEANKKVERGLYQQAELLREAAALAKRYEDAPVAYVQGCQKAHDFSGHYTFLYGDSPIEFKGQSVRLVREPARRDG